MVRLNLLLVYVVNCPCQKNFFFGLQCSLITNVRLYELTQCFSRCYCMLLSKHIGILLISFGDSGGPLLKYTETGEVIVVAVASAILSNSKDGQCGDKTLPGLFVRTSANFDFLLSNPYFASQLDDPTLSTPHPPNSTVTSEPSDNPSKLDKDSIIIIGSITGAVILFTVVFALIIAFR